MRLWNTVELSAEANVEDDKRFEKELALMKEKRLAETSKKFYEDLQEERESSKSLMNVFGLLTLQDRILSVLL